MFLAFLSILKKKINEVCFFHNLYVYRVSHCKMSFFYPLLEPTMSIIWITLGPSVIQNTRAQNVCPGWPVYDLKCLCCRVWEWDRGLPLLPAFSYLILMTWRTCDSNLVMMFSLASKWQALKVGMPIYQPFYEINLRTSELKVLAFWSQWRYNDQI